LVRCGYVVDWVQDGNTAWDYLLAMPNGYSVAILDWMLPGISGLELCQRLRSHKNPLPVMILTACSGMCDREAISSFELEMKHLRTSTHVSV
jgi:DNA-binding response OmpR family regulator